MEKPEVKLSSLLALLIGGLVMGAMGGFVIGGLTDNPPAGWSFFALTVSHIVVAGVAVVLTHDIAD